MHTASVIGDYGEAKLEIVESLGNTQLWHIRMDDQLEYWTMWKTDAERAVKRAAFSSAVSDTPEQALYSS